MERGLNQGFYDLFAAAISKFSLGFISPVQVLTWLSPILSGLSCLLLGSWLYRKVGRSCGLLFYILILLFPGPLTQVSATGNGDHHTFEIFLTTLLVISLTKALDSRSAVKWIALPALCMYLFYITWPGAALHLLFVGLSFYGVAFRAAEPAQDRALVLKGFLFAVSTICLMKLTEVAAPNYVPWAASRSTFLMGCSLLLVGYPVLVFLAQKIPQKSRGFAGVFLLVALALSTQVSPQISRPLAALFQVRSSSISEQAPVTLGLLFSFYGPCILGLITTPILLYRSGKLSACLIPVMYSLGLTLFWIQTHECVYYPALAVAGLAAYSVSRLPRKAWILLLLVLFLALFVPTVQKPWLTKMQAKSLILNSPSMEQATNWLAQFKRSYGREQTYGIMAPWDLGSMIAYLTKTPVGWSQTESPQLAHYLFATDPYRIYSRFGRIKRKHRFILIDSENLEGKLASEFALTGENPTDLFKQGPRVEWAGKVYQLPATNALFEKLVLVQLFNNLARNIGYYRLVYESPQKVVRAIRIHDNLRDFGFVALPITELEAENLAPIFDYRDVVHQTSRGLLVNPYLSPDIRIFETVTGAFLVGETKPNTEVQATLTIASPFDQKPKELTWSTLSDPQGGFELRLPYPTNRTLYDIPGTIRVQGSYHVEIGETTWEVEITEQQVQTGAPVPLVP